MTSITIVKPEKIKPEFHTITPEELSPDKTVLCEFVIPGNVATKKTSQRFFKMGKRTVLLPSANFLSYEKYCKDFCEDIWKKQGKDPMDFGVCVTYKIYLDRWILPDACGAMQSLGDILEKWGVISNDAWLHWSGEEGHWFGGVDKDNPRTEIKITRCRHLKEEYRKEKEEELRNKNLRAEARQAKSLKQIKVTNENE